MAPPPDSADGASAVISKNVWLPANSLLILRGEARYAWQHGIAWRRTDCISDREVIQRGRRISLTFRCARPPGAGGGPCRCLWPAMCDGQNPEAHALPSRIGAGAAGAAAAEGLAEFAGAEEVACVAEATRPSKAGGAAAQLLAEGIPGIC